MFASREKITAVLTELGARLDAQGIHGDIYIVGGAAMLLGYDRLAVTSDIDAAFSPADVIDEIVEQMYRENKPLGRDWLNQKVLPLLPRIADAGAWEALNIPGLTVSIASPEFLLAMKVRAARGRRDLEDVGLLTDILGYTRIEQVWDTCELVWGFDALRSDAREMVAEYLRDRGVA